MVRSALTHLDAAGQATMVDVENGNILRNMLAQILTGKLSIQQAASSASDNIASVLNQS